MSSPKISICIPTYNYAEFICQAIDSVLMQDYEEFELIIVDDRSTDETAQVVQKYLDKGDKRLRLIVNDVNRGMVNNWNYCLEIANGEYIKFLFADDYFIEPDALRKMSDMLDTNKNISLVSTSRTVVDADSLPRKLLIHYDNDCTRPGTSVIEECLCRMVNLIGEPSAVMFRRKHADRGFDVSYKQLVDLEMWFYLLEQGDYAYISTSLCSFRVHDKQQTAVNRSDRSTVLETGKLHDAYLNKPYITAGEVAKFYIRYDYKYKLWKSFRKRRAEIRRHIYDTNRARMGFYLFFPIYKTVKPLIKLINRKEYRLLKAKTI